MHSIEPSTLISALPHFYSKVYNTLIKYSNDRDSESIRVFNSFNDEISIEYLDSDVIKKTVDFYFDTGDYNYLIEVVVMILMLDVKSFRENLKQAN